MLLLLVPLNTYRLCDPMSAVPQKQLSFKERPPHLFCEWPGSEYFQLCGPEVLDAEAQGRLSMIPSEYFPDLLQGSESPSWVLGVQAE